MMLFGKPVDEQILGGIATQTLLSKKKLMCYQATQMGES